MEFLTCEFFFVTLHIQDFSAEQKIMTNSTWRKTADL